MCRTTEYHDKYNYNHNQNRQDGFNLKMKAFFVRLSGFTPKKPLPESLTLLFLPRINENALQIHGSTIRPDSPAFISLFRVNVEIAAAGDLIFGTREPVLAGDGVQFEVYLREAKVLKGLFRKDDAHRWKLDCNCQLAETDHKDFTAMPGASEAEVCVALEGSHTDMMTKRVAVVVKKRKNKYYNNNFNFKGSGLGDQLQLDEIPELTDEYTTEPEDDECHCASTTGCACTDPTSASTGMEMDMQGVGWAVDLGIWVMCLGVGFLLSKASTKSLGRRRTFS